MNAGGFTDIAMGIIWLAVIAVLVAHPNTSKVVTAVGNSFSNSISAASKGGV